MKTRSDPDRLVKRYLADLNQALAGLPTSRWREIHDDVSAHRPWTALRPAHIPTAPSPTE